MIIMATVTYPMTSIGPVVKVFIENMKAPMPEYIEMDGPYSRWGGDGIVATTIYRIQDDRALEGVKEIVSRDAKYGDVGGYKIESNIVLSIEDALAIVGEKMP
jgi:hypothetical protein